MSDDKIVFDHIEEDADHHNMRLLWKAAVAQAVRDLTCTDTEVVLEVAQWLGTQDFKETCDHALMDPDWLDAEVRRIMKMNNPYRRYHLIKLSQQINSEFVSGEHRDKSADRD